MDIIIDKTKKLSEVQEEFKKRFPYLKIEFYKKQHAEGMGSPKENTLDNELRIEQAQQIKSSGTIKIHGLMKVAELESSFAQTFGLPVQVFRKSGSVWLQTTATDHWTLAEQNHKAMEKIADATEPTPDHMDRQELE